MSPLPDHPKQRIAARCAQELRAGEVVNLGLGIPTLTANYLDADAGVIFHTENGAFGFGGRPRTCPGRPAGVPRRRRRAPR